MASAEARPMPVNYRALGMTAVAEGRFAPAIPALLTATQQNPNDAEAWLNLGRARLGQKEWQGAKIALVKAAELRPGGHGPTEATLAWSLAKLGEFEEAEAALQRAEQGGYSPAALHALRGHCAVQMREDRRADAALTKALAIDPNNRAALLNRAELALRLAMDDNRLPTPDAFALVEKALTAGPTDAYVELWAARYYARAAHKPGGAKGDWHADPAAAKARCLALLRQAAEHGVPEGTWKGESTYTFLFGDPKVFSRDWVKPTAEADPSDFGRCGNPLVEFGG
jgi:tetratricopeptide (TPR) repeat protein